MSEPKLYVKFSWELPPEGFEAGVEYQVIRSVDATDNDGRAYLHFLIANTNQTMIVFVDSRSVEICNWKEFSAAIAAAQELAQAQSKLFVPGQRH